MSQKLKETLKVSYYISGNLNLNLDSKSIMLNLKLKRGATFSILETFSLEHSFNLKKILPIGPSYVFLQTL